MTGTDDLGAVLTRLYATIESRRGGDPDASYTAKLLADGPARCAKKLGEEGVEAALAGAANDAPALAAEAADVLYHLLVLMVSVGVAPGDVAVALAAREGTSGHAEKASRARDQKKDP
ncbi:MAG: phosphoribosyl-ATP diphosphatase [Pseudomonadota bacterium]